MIRAPRALRSRSSALPAGAFALLAAALKPEQGGAQPQCVSVTSRLSLQVVARAGFVRPPFSFRRFLPAMGSFAM